MVYYFSVITVARVIMGARTGGMRLDQLCVSRFFAVCWWCYALVSSLALFIELDNLSFVCTGSITVVLRLFVPAVFVHLVLPSLFITIQFTPHGRQVYVVFTGDLLCGFTFIWALSLVLALFCVLALF